MTTTNHKSPVLLLEDDPDLLELITFHLSDNNLLPLPAPDGQHAARILSSLTSPLHAAVLDRSVPAPSGDEICRRIRSSPIHKNTPVLFLTAKTSELDALEGYRAGADDYISKPFSMKLLVAKVLAAARRSQPQSPSPIQVLTQQRQVLINGRPLQLTYAEFQILSSLAKNPNSTLSRDALLNAVGRTNADAGPRSIDVHVSRIRRRLQNLPNHNVRILSQRSFGYSLSIHNS